MRVAIVHGYFLADSGSGIYVRELAKNFVKQGHEVTLVCQDRFPERYDFIDSAYLLDSDNRDLSLLFERYKKYAGSCRLVRPDIHGILLTYVESGEKEFLNDTFQTAPFESIDSYVNDNIKALTAVFKRWPPEFIQANHAIMQPYEVLRALKETGLDEVGFTITMHGSALNFSVKADPRLVPYFKAAAKEARSIFALSDSSAEDTRKFAAELGLDIAEKTRVIPPGVDTDLFRPTRNVQEGKGTIGIFAGRLIWTKGPQYAIAAMPFILRKNPDFELRLAGAGPLEPALRRMIEMLSAGEIQAAQEFVQKSPEMGFVSGWGEVIPEMNAAEMSGYTLAACALSKKVTFLGHLTHEELAPAFAEADLSLTPSVYAEAYGLTVIEAVAAGAVPIATYQTGLRTPLDILAGELADPDLISIKPNGNLTRSLAVAVTQALTRYPTKEFEHRKRLRNIAISAFSWDRTASAYIACIAR